MPLRDDRRGRRATIGSGKAPLRPDFSSAGPSTTIKPIGIASDSPTPSNQTNDVRNQDSIFDASPFQREGLNSHNMGEAPGDIYQVERSGSLQTTPSVEAHADTPSVEAYAYARSLKTQPDAHSAKKHLDAHSAKPPADLLSVKVYADAHSVKAYADGQSIKAYVDLHSVKADADAQSVKAHADVQSVKAYADVHSAEAYADGQLVRAHSDVPSIKTSATAPTLDAYDDVSSVKAYADASSVKVYARAPSEAARANVPSDAAHAEVSSSAAQPRSLLEPADVLMAMVRPFLRLRSAMIRFANLPITRSSTVSSLEPADEGHRAGVIVERSFANEVASLLQAPLIEVVTPARPEREARSPFVPPTEPPPLLEQAAPAMAERLAIADPLSAGPPIERPVPDRADVTASSDISPVGAPTTAQARPNNRFERYEPAEKPAFRDGVHGAQNGVIDDSSALALDAWKGGLTEKRDGVVAGEPSEQNIVVARFESRHERAVPITRLPLRPQGLNVTWMAEVPGFERSGPLSRTTRHELLERLIRNPGNVSSDTIARAYRQEEGEGRAIALRALLRNFPQAGRAAFVEALRVGSDEERALAVDGLTAIGAREEMTPALSDRVDAIAAKAALSYVGTFERADYRAQLPPFIDETRIEAILNLLAGIVE